MKTLKTIFLVLFLALSAFIAANWQLFQNNIQPLIYQRGPAMTERLNNFSGDMTEAKVLRMVTVPLFCAPNTAGLSLGDRVCYSNISSYAGITALRVAFFFKGGYLANIKIDVPWWLHNQLAKQLIKDFGPPTGAQNVAHRGVRLVGWKLERGVVVSNRDRNRNPLVWNTIHWLSEQESKELGGIFIPLENSATNPQ